MKLLLSGIVLMIALNLRAEEPNELPQTKLQLHQVMLSDPVVLKSDTLQFKSPKYKQGFFCNFEDQLNRKKVPIDFSLGNNKY